jgi:hypothetical protein
MGCGERQNTPDTDASVKVQSYVGYRGTLRDFDDNGVVGARSFNGLADGLKANAISDTYRLRELKTSGELILIEPNTRVLVMEDVNELFFRVRVLQGDAAGRALFVSKKNVEVDRERTYQD